MDWSVVSLVYHMQTKIKKYKKPKQTNTSDK